MNQLKNGTLLVVIATVVTAVLILMTGRDDSQSSKDQYDVVTIEKESSEIAELQKEVARSESEIKVVVDISTEDLQQTMSSVNERVRIKAPEGPFIKAPSDLVIIEDSQENSVANNSNDVKEKTEQLIKVEPITVVATSSQNEILNHIAQPIWMDQKLGDFKSVEQGDVIFNIMPTSPDGIQGENPKEVVTSKNDKFATNAIPADYNYQQMPIYNGGYYIAPMPSYLMPSILPGNMGDKN